MQFMGVDPKITFYDSADREIGSAIELGCEEHCWSL
jgi:hypothetical protein